MITAACSLNYRVKYSLLQRAYIRQIIKIMSKSRPAADNDEVQRWTLAAVNRVILKSWPCGWGHAVSLCHSNEHGRTRGMPYSFIQYPMVPYGTTRFLDGPWRCWNATPTSLLKTVTITFVSLTMSSYTTICSVITYIVHDAYRINFLSNITWKTSINSQPVCMKHSLVNEQASLIGNTLVKNIARKTASYRRPLHTDTGSHLPP